MGEVSELLDLPFQRVQYWITQGIFDPYKNSSGPGTGRKFSYKNLLQIELARRFSLLKMRTDKVATIISSLEKDCPWFWETVKLGPGFEDPKAILILLVSKDGEEVSSSVATAEEAQDQLADALSEGGLVIMLNLNLVKQELQEGLEDLD